MTSNVKVRRGVMDMVEFVIPDSTLNLLWTGPGSHQLYLTTPKGQMIPVEPDRFRLATDTLKSAKSAAQAFIDEGHSS